MTGGNHTIIAVYGSDVNFGGSTSAGFTEQVLRLGTTTTITTASPPSPSDYGQAVTFTATVMPTVTPVEPTGTVSFYENSVTPTNLLGTGTLGDVGGTATATFTTTPTQFNIGSHTIIAVYTPAAADLNFATST